VPPEERSATATQPGAANAIWQAYETARAPTAQLYTWQEGVGYQPHTWDEWRRAAERSAVGLRALGARPGVRVAAVLTNAFEVCAAVLGTWLTGATLLSLPTLRRGQSPSDYLAQLRRLCRQADAQLLLLEERFLGMVGAEDLGTPTAGFAALPRDGALAPEPPGDEEIAFVQYSSGSVSDPKGCMLTLGAISAQERMLERRLGLDSERDVCAMWLPLSHDMGLFGCLLLSWTTGTRLAVGTPERFLRKPLTWMEDLAAFDATIAVAPNFALALTARRARTRAPTEPVYLETLVLGGERIEWSTLLDAHRTLGFDLRAMTPAYGLAEATLAVTMKRRGAPPTVRGVDTEALRAGALLERGADERGALAMVGCGPPMDGVRVRIDGGEAVGRICVASPALTVGYLADKRETRRHIVGGELRTEDLGFVVDGELHVVGRVDDVMLVGGRNIHARDVELAVSDCDGVRTGCATLVDVAAEGSPQLVMVCEPLAGATDLAHLAGALASLTFEAVGVRVEECVFVRQGVLPKTPSGKIQRFRCRRLVESGHDAVLERVAL
jgi:acyl-CoA synthetase (AMP-forming)/AMP-acid ligase II